VFLSVYNKAQAERIWNREFKPWTILQWTDNVALTQRILDTSDLYL